MTAGLFHHLQVVFGLFLTWGRRISVFIVRVLRSCVSSLCTYFSFIFFVSPHRSFGIPLFRCPLTSIIRALIRPTTCSSVFPSTCPKHLSLASLIFSLMFATPALALIYSFLIFSILSIPIIHLDVLCFHLQILMEFHS